MQKETVVANNRTTVPEQAIPFAHNPKYTLGVDISKPEIYRKSCSHYGGSFGSEQI